MIGRLTVSAAAAVGWLVGSGRSIPGIAGAVLVTVGLGLAWLPLGVVAAGAWLLLVDARIPARRRLSMVPSPTVLRREAG